MGLAAMVQAAPLAVAGQASGPFDDPKAWWVVAVAGATGLAVALLGPGPLRAPAPDRLGQAARLCIVAYLAWYIASTATSLAPGLSLVGNFGRGLGLFALVATVLVCPLTMAWAWSAERARTLVDAALWGSVPVCLLALGQALGWDPLPGAWDPMVRGMRVRSTFGQHIFLGSYLAVLIPLAAARLAWPSDPGEPHPRSRWASGLMAAWALGAVGLAALAYRWSPAWWGLGPWGLGGAVLWSRRPAPLPRAGLAALLAAQMLLVVLSGARGAFLSVLLGLTVTGISVLWQRRARKALIAASASLALVALLVVLLNVPGLGVARLAPLMVLQRLSHVVDLQPYSPEWFRVQVWRSIVGGWGRLLAGEPVVPAPRPRLRAAVGYGLETQLHTLEPMVSPSLGVLRTREGGGRGLRFQYLIDRAHSVPLDHLVTAGLVGLGLWGATIGCVLAAGARGIRLSTGAERTLRLGALGAVAAHLADGLVGIATPVPLALFWLAAGVLVSPRWSAGRPAPAPARKTRWLAAPAIGLVALAIAVTQTSWLAASLAYARGARSALAGRPADALPDFERARALMPWVPLAGEASAYLLLQAASEPDVPRRRVLLDRAAATLAETRARGVASGTGWSLAAQVAFAQARAGEAGKLAASLEAFPVAVAWRPEDPQLRSMWAWALLEQGDVVRAGQVARAALERGRDDHWLAWAVLARLAVRDGDPARAEQAGSRARSAAPAEARAMLEEFLRRR